MKKHMIIGIAMAMGMISVDAISASAADICGKCADSQSIQRFQQETDSLSTTLKSRDLELRSLYSFEGVDIAKIDALEREIGELESKIDASASKFGIHACIRN